MLADKFSLLLALTLLANFQAGGAPDDPAAPPRPSGAFVATNGMTLSGWISVDSFHVPYGQNITIVDDLSLFAKDHILIEGTITISDRTLNSTSADAPALHLKTPGELVVLGNIVGGKGRCFAKVAPETCLGQRGGSGSDLLFESDSVLLNARISTGDGGVGGGHGDGGSGGSIRLFGGTPMNPADSVVLAAYGLEIVPGLPGGIFAGGGGRGGANVPGSNLPASSGGNGGGAMGRRVTEDK